MMTIFAEYERTRNWINAEPCWGADREDQRKEVHDRIFAMEETILAAKEPTRDTIEAQMRLLHYVNGPDGATLAEEVTAGLAANVLAFLAWLDLEQSFAWFSPTVVQALHHARAAGMRPNDLASVNFPNRVGAYVSFYLDDADELRSFDANGERSWHS